MNTEAKHTPTPWRIMPGTYAPNSPTPIVVDPWRAQAPIGQFLLPTDAARAVRAVNSHAALVEALQQIESLCVIGQEFSGAAQNALHIARAALATAREG